MNPLAPERKQREAEARELQLTQAVQLYGSFILRYLAGLTRNQHDAEDLAQKLWSYAYQRFPLDGITSLPLLRKKAYQLFIDHYRSRKNDRENASLETAPEPATSQFHHEPLTEAEEEACKARFWELFPSVRLTQQQKEAFWLAARVGLTYEEISALFNVGVSTVGDWVLIVKKRCAESLNAPPE